MWFVLKTRQRKGSMGTPTEARPTSHRHASVALRAPMMPMISMTLALIQWYKMPFLGANVQLSWTGYF